MLFVVFEIVCFSLDNTADFCCIHTPQKSRPLHNKLKTKKQVFSYFIEKSFRLESENSVIMVLGAILQMSNQI